MAAPSNFLSAFATDLTLPAGVATPLSLPIAGARDWCFTMRNTGANPITAATSARNPLGTQAGPARAFAADIPLAAGATTEVRAEREPLATLDLVLTSDDGTTVRIEGGGR